MNPFVEEVVERAAAAMGMEPSAVVALISVPPDEGLGDYAIPCFALAKERKQSPVARAGDIAREIANKIDATGTAPSHINRVEAVGPYINFTLDRSRFIGYVLGEVSRQEAGYGSRNQGQGKTFVIDFSSPNLAKPFSIAHLRSTAIGNAIYRLHDFTGWRCIGINHLGDYGANFGQLLAAYRLWADEDAVRANAVPELFALYVRFNEEVAENPDLTEQARACLRALAEGDAEMVGLWRYFVDESTKEAERIYGILDVHFDVFLGESFFADKLADVVAQFESAGLAEESDGALIVRLEDGEDMAPCMLRTSNNTSTYHSRDIAALLHRREQYDFDKMVYVTDMRQALHFRQVFKALELLGLNWVSRCVHAPFGMMSFKGAAMSSRKGHIVFLEEVLGQAVALTSGIIAAKNPDLANSDEIANQVGISAVIFADVNNRRTRDISFDLEEVLTFDGETGPYVQYTHARFCSILRKHGSPADPDADLSRLGELAEMRVARQLSEFPDTVERACDENEPSYIAAYLIDLATVANRFYNEQPVLVAADEPLTVARIRLVDSVCLVLRSGLSLLGMKAPQEM
jgi:arginyl-tRNA synthetase